MVKKYGGATECVDGIELPPNLYRSEFGTGYSALSVG